MALRKILTLGEETLRKSSRKVTVIDQRICDILDDMVQTLKSAQGIGLAAPQVGILRRIVVIDTGEEVIDLINPEILSQQGEQVGSEACLSVPGKHAIVKRPMSVKIKALGRDGRAFTLEGEGLMARAFCHEIDHLDGKLYLDCMEEGSLADDVVEQ